MSHSQPIEVSAIHLRTLLDMKGRSGYSEHAVTPELRVSAGVSAAELVQKAKMS